MVGRDLSWLHGGVAGPWSLPAIVYWEEMGALRPAQLGSSRTRTIPSWFPSSVLFPVLLPEPWGPQTFPLSCPGSQ